MKILRSTKAQKCRGGERPGTSVQSVGLSRSGITCISVLTELFLLGGEQGIGTPLLLREADVVVVAPLGVGLSCIKEFLSHVGECLEY